MHKNSCYLGMFKVISIWISISIGLSLLRLSAPFLGLNQYKLSSILVYAAAAIFISSGVVVIFVRFLSKEQIFFLFLTPILLCFYGLAVGLINEYSWSEQLKHICYVLLPFMMITYGRCVAPYLSEKQLQAMMKPVFVINLIACICYIVLKSQYPIYPGFGTQAMVYAALYFFSTKQHRLFFISLFLALIEGKRSMQLSLLIASMFASGQSRLLKHIGIVGMGSFVSIVLVLFIIDNFDLYGVVGLSRVRYINPFSNDFDPYLGSSGRLDEYIGALTVYKSKVRNYFMGTGFGFKYNWVISYNMNAAIEEKTYVHSTPILFFILFGPFITCFIYGYVVKVLLWTRTLGLDSFAHDAKLKVFFSSAAMFYIISSFFSLNATTDVFGPMCLGVCIYFIAQQRFLASSDVGLAY